MLKDCSALVDVSRCSSRWSAAAGFVAGIKWDPGVPDAK